MLCECIVSFPLSSHLILVCVIFSHRPPASPHCLCAVGWRLEEMYVVCRLISMENHTVSIGEISADGWVEGTWTPSQKKNTVWGYNSWVENVLYVFIFFKYFFWRNSLTFSGNKQGFYWGLCTRLFLDKMQHLPSFQMTCYLLLS